MSSVRLSRAPQVEAGLLDPAMVASVEQLSLQGMRDAHTKLEAGTAVGKLAFEWDSFPEA